MCKKNIANIDGRVLLQTLPSESYNYEATLAHARLYDNEFARVGISRDRFCIKIPSTGPALNALKVLSDEGIPTLGTAMFGLQQAIACSQAGALYVSPYFNGQSPPSTSNGMRMLILIRNSQSFVRILNRHYALTLRMIRPSTIPCLRESSKSLRLTSNCTARRARSSRW